MVNNPTLLHGYWGVIGYYPMILTYFGTFRTFLMVLFNQKVLILSINYLQLVILYVEVRVVVDSVG